MKLRFGTLSLITFILLSAGCATMSEDECHVADWQALGYEDGAEGRALSHMGKRRESCAKYGVQLNTSTYRIGRDEGLELFCTELRGFSEGRSGENYAGVCPAGLEGLFLKGYETGRDLFVAKSAVEEIEAAIHDRELEREHLLDDLTELGTLLVGDEATRDERVSMLADIARFKVRHTELGLEIDDLRFELAQRRMEYQNLLARSPYPQ
ncbi:DUF2799 domain-containing protein [Microbulbifer sp. THAF38]|uniref:DUF2799 domain-containing protein n=1 Tax=Microbulbifer sp. THAF38 TaxID=2587856 RepID=UPI001268EFAC|nr:DUF2799 domain-containing protein [Microbulbifer sp. THAF38]QFT56136.1 hypothetical protein FIU95_16425 [Microbulbifer sp. THAF38]